MNEHLEAMLRKVTALLAQADHPNTDPIEANTFRAKAEALMYKYRIDEAMMAAAAPAGAELKPEWSRFDVCSAYSEFRSYYRWIAEAVIEHVGMRAVYKRDTRAGMDPEGNIVPGTSTEWIYCECVGYESDIRIAEALYVECMLEFQKRLEPKLDRSLSDQENAYVMRSAGMEGWRIAQLIFGSTEKRYRPKARALFKAEAIKRGEDPAILLGKGNSMKAFREDFAAGFWQEVNNRLRQMRMSRSDDGQGTIVLASRNTAINEMFYAVYPQYRPVQTGTTSTQGYVDPRLGCARCQKAKSGYCRDHAYLKPRAYRAGRDTNYAAVARGREAARNVDLGGTSAGRKVSGNQPRGEL